MAWAWGLGEMRELRVSPWQFDGLQRAIHFLEAQGYGEGEPAHWLAQEVADRWNGERNGDR